MNTTEIAKVGVTYTPTTKTETTTVRRVVKSGDRGTIVYQRQLTDGGWGTEMWCGHGSWQAWLSKHKVTRSDAAPDPQKELLKRVRDMLNTVDAMDPVGVSYRVAEVITEIDEALK